MKKTNFKLNYPDQGQPIVILEEILFSKKKAENQSPAKQETLTKPQAAKATPEPAAEQQAPKSAPKPVVEQLVSKSVPESVVEQPVSESAPEPTIEQPAVEPEIKAQVPESEPAVEEVEETTNEPNVLSDNAEAAVEPRVPDTETDANITQVDNEIEKETDANITQVDNEIEKETDANITQVDDSAEKETDINVAQIDNGTENETDTNVTQANDTMAELEWTPEYGLNHISDDVLAKAQTVLDKGGIGDVFFATNDQGNKVVAFHVFYEPCEPTNLDYDNLQVDKTSTVFKRFPNVPLRTCNMATCGEARCIPVVAAYIKYAQQHGIYDELMKARDEYRAANEGVNQDYQFNWMPNNAERLNAVSPYVFDIVQAIIDQGAVALKPYPTDDGKFQADFRMISACAHPDQNIDVNVIEELYAKSQMVDGFNHDVQVHHATYTTESDFDKIERPVCKDCKTTCCPYKLAAYMKYLHSIGQDATLEDAKSQSVSNVDARNYDVSVFPLQKIAGYVSGRLLTQKLIYPDAILEPTILAPGTTVTVNSLYKNEELGVAYESEILNRICVNLGGIAAEAVMFGEFSNQGMFDLSEATEMATDMVKEYGMSEHGLASFGLLDDERKTEINQILATQFDRARKALSAHKADLEQIYTYLQQHESINDSILSGFITAKPAGTKRGRKPKNASQEIDDTAATPESPDASTNDTAAIPESTEASVNDAPTDAE